MANPVYHGNPLTDLVPQAESDLTTDQFNISEYTANWVIQRDSAISKAPQIGDESATYPGLFIVSRRIHNTPPDVSEISAVYRGTIAVAFNLPPPPKYAMNDSGLDRPIQQHPLFDNETNFPTSFKVFKDAKDSTGAIVKVFDGFKDDSPKRGIEAYIVGTGRWTEIRYLQQEPAESLIYGIGKRSHPVGLLGATAGHWLLTGASVEQEGRFWVWRREWTYSGQDKAWDSDLYGD